MRHGGERGLHDPPHLNMLYSKLALEMALEDWSQMMISILPLEEVQGS